MFDNLRNFISDQYDGTKFFKQGRTVYRGITSLYECAYTSLYTERMNHAPLNYELEGKVKNSYIVGTGQGLLLVDQSKARRLIHGHFYGITRYPKSGHWLAFQSTGRYSRIIKFELHNEKVQNRETVVAGFVTAPHQIDCFNDLLFIPETYSNLFYVYNLERGEIINKFPPNGVQTRDRSAGKYCHFNSVLVNEDKIFLLAHNNTKKTGVKSEVYVLDFHDKNVENIIKTEGSAAHNIAFKDNQLIYCDSLGSRLMWGGESFFKNEDYFVRGLSLTDNEIAVGGSEFAKRENRSSKDGRIWFFDSDGNKTGQLNLYQIGPVQEIRSLSTDYSLSEDAHTEDIEPEEVSPNVAT